MALEKSGDQLDRSCVKKEVVRWVTGDSNILNTIEHDGYLDWTHLVQKLSSEKIYGREYVSDKTKRKKT